MKKRFNKPALTVSEQVDLLRQRGMRIEDEQKAEFYLSHLNYYRLAAYWLPFEQNHATHQFQDGTRFSDVLNSYFFDRELRLLVLDAIERIEVSIRTQWAYTLAHKHGPHSHVNPALYRSAERWEKDLRKLRLEISRSTETYIKHFKHNYSDDFPPIWAACEVISLGLLSRLYDNIRSANTRNAISASYDLEQSVFGSWLHHLCIIRNICAHHSRLWNREFTVTPKQPKKPETTADAFLPESRRLYNSTVTLLHFMDIVSPEHQFRDRFLALTYKYNVPLAKMGFPENWLGRRLWKNQRDNGLC
jgi:abortive infection bacteriophage resistance protein